MNAAGEVITHKQEQLSVAPRDRRQLRVCYWFPSAGIDKWLPRIVRVPKPIVSDRTISRHNIDTDRLTTTIRKYCATNAPTLNGAVWEYILAP